MDLPCIDLWLLAAWCKLLVVWIFGNGHFLHSLSSEKVVCFFSPLLFVLRTLVINLLCKEIARLQFT